MPQVSLWVWLGIIVVAVIIEVCTVDMTSIWFAVAGLVALVLSIFDEISWVVQLIVFIVTSVILILTFRPLCKKLLLKHTDAKTGTDSFIGKKVTMLSTAKFGELGSVKIADVVWSAMPDDENLTIEEGTIVEILRVDGNKLIVKTIQDAETTEQNNIEQENIEQDKTE